MESKWYKIRNLIGENRRYTSSDGGSLKVGNENFNIFIPNGYGDGKMRYAILENDKFFEADKLLEYFTIIEGKFNIYDYDWGNDVDQEVEGRFAIFYGDGFVVFVKLN